MVPQTTHKSTLSYAHTHTHTQTYKDTISVSGWAIKSTLKEIGVQLCRLIIRFTGLGFIYSFWFLYWYFLVFSLCWFFLFLFICFTQVVSGALLCVHRRAAGWNALQFPRAQRHLTVYCPRNRIANVNPLDLVNYKLQSIYCIYIYWYIKVKRHTERYVQWREEIWSYFELQKMRELLQWTKILWANFPVQTEMFTEQLWECTWGCLCVCVCACAWACVYVCAGVNDCGLNAHAERFNWHFPVLPCDILQCVRCNAELQLWAVDTFVSVSEKHLRKICHRNA